MADSNIVLIDTSRIGQNALRSGNNASSLVRITLGMGQSNIDDIKDKISSSKDKLINSTKDDVAKAIKEAVGLDQFYTVHARYVCSGNFANKNDSSGGLDVRRCRSMYQINLADLMETDLKVPGRIQEAIQRVGGAASRVLMAAGHLYVVAAVFCGASAITSLGAAMGSEDWLHLISAGVAAVALVMLLVASGVTTAGSNQIAQAIDDQAAWLGMRVEVGFKFRNLSWAATALIGAVTLYHVLAALLATRKRSTHH